jgi:hypothetical protein
VKDLKFHHKDTKDTKKKNPQITQISPKGLNIAGELNRRLVVGRGFFRLTAQSGRKSA